MWTTWKGLTYQLSENSPVYSDTGRLVYAKDRLIRADAHDWWRWLGERRDVIAMTKDGIGPVITQISTLRQIRDGVFIRDVSVMHTWPYCILGLGGVLEIGGCLCYYWDSLYISITTLQIFVTSQE